VNFDEYQKMALRTAKVASRTERLTEGALGLGGETGEVVDHIKKHRYQGHDLNIDHLKGELGDVLWYVATMAYAVGLDLSEVAGANVAKLRERYPDGFDPKRSRDRGDGLLGDAQAEGIAVKIISQPSQPVEPGELLTAIDGLGRTVRLGPSEDDHGRYEVAMSSPTVTIPSERLELEERWAEHVKGAGRVVVKGGT
jgi:NTP pyrophosphatase (non-canonical NTP hydrolase)